MCNLNKAPNDFFENWDKIKSMNYKNVIELHVKKSNKKKIMTETQFEIDQFPENVQKELNFSETNSFYNDIARLFKDSNWWQTAMVTDACKFYLSSGRNFIPYFKNYAEADSNLSQKERNEIFALYQLCTLFISWYAIQEKEIREVIGIRKSLFFR